jgi:hypothetical protein
VHAAAIELGLATLDGDLDRCRAAITPDFVFYDRRRSGAGRLQGADAWLAWMAALFAQSPDAISEALHYPAVADHAALVVSHTFGTAHGRGAFETVHVGLWRFRGSLAARLEQFEPDDLELARARFEELRGEEE